MSSELARRLETAGAPAQFAQADTLRQTVHEKLLEDTEIGALRWMSQEQLEQRVAEFTEETVHEHGYVISDRERRQVEVEVMHEVTGYGPIQPLLEDETITEVMVNGPHMIFIEREGQIEESDRRFIDDDHLMRIIDKIISPLGRRLDESVPMVDARLPDGSRVNAIIPPLAINGPCLTVRKFPKERLRADDLVALSTMTSQMRDFLEACVKAHINVIISGNTGSGKTTTLNVMSSFIPNRERIVTIEDAAELQLQQRHVVTLESRPANIEGRAQVTIRDLVRNSLRMRPDRIIVGEVRGPEALDMLQAMNTGHDGSLGTVHSNSPRDTLSRLETMVLMAGTELPSKAIREQMASALHLIIHQSRLRDGSRRIVRITEVQRMEGDQIILEDLFRYDRLGVDSDGKLVGEFVACGVRPHFMELIEAEGFDLSPEVFGAPKGAWE